MTRQVRQLTLSALMCALIIVSTLWLKFTIPGTDVMFSSQVFFVLLCGLLLPPRYCFYTLGAYLLLGLAGLPVFTATVGPAVIATPSFGYLIAFPFEAAVTSAAAGRLVNQKGGRYICGAAQGSVSQRPRFPGRFAQRLLLCLSSAGYRKSAAGRRPGRPPRKAAGADEVSLTPRQAFFSLLFSSFAIFFRAVSKMAPTTRGPALIAMAAPIWN